MKENRTRNNLIKVYLNDKEYKIMKEKMKVSDSSTISLFIRRLIVRGNVIVYDLTSIFELSSQISRIGNNINQIAKKMNQGDGIYNNDINFLKKSMRDINETMINLYHDMIEQLEED